MKFAQCRSCRAKWRLKSKDARVTNLALQELPKDGRGLYRVNSLSSPLYTILEKEFPSSFWSNLRLGADIDWEYLAKEVSSEIQNAVILEKGEKILATYEGQRFIEKMQPVGIKLVGPASPPVPVIRKEDGNLVLTNQRVLWVQKRKKKGFQSYLTRYDTLLEEIKGISGEIDSYTRPFWRIHIVDAKGENMFLLRVSIELLKPAIESIIKTRKEEVEYERKRERVHVLLDFSFLKNYMERGGLVIQSVKCLECGAPIKLPEKGSQAVCDYCGKTVYAQDVFTKIKDLIG